MIIFSAALFGALFGALQARRRKGNRLDIAQYAAVYAIAFSLVGLFFLIFLNRVV